MKRCFDALNDFGRWRRGVDVEWPDLPSIDHRENPDSVDGTTPDRSYNEIVRGYTENRNTVT